MFKTDETIKEKVYKEFGRTGKSVEEDVETIKQWFKTQPHLPEIMEDAKIRNFLILNKFSIEKAKKKIDMYYTFKGLMPEILGKNPSQLKAIKRVFQNTYMGAIPKALDDVYRVYFIKMKKEDCMDAIAYTNAWFTTFEVRLYEDFMVGDVIVYDWENTTFSDLKDLAALMPKLIKIYQFEVDTGDSVLAKILPKDLIPKDYGGDAPSLKLLSEMMQQKVTEYDSRFEYLETLKVNEDLRPEKLTNDEILGYYGNFKQIKFD